MVGEGPVGQRCQFHLYDFFFSTNLVARVRLSDRQEVLG